MSIILSMKKEKEVLEYMEEKGIYPIGVVFKEGTPLEDEVVIVVDYKEVCRYQLGEDGIVYMTSSEDSMTLELEMNEVSYQELKEKLILLSDYVISSSTGVLD